MADKYLHIVSFDVPYPADYGGVIDVFYRIKALHALGVKIKLHCFEYGRGMPEQLKEYVDEIQYYKRRKSFLDGLAKLPFIVKSRSSRHLIRNLLKDDHPILFEGLHCAFYLSDDRLKSRIKLVRTHNIEHEYYAELAKQSKGIHRKFFTSESRKLKQFEPILKHADGILAIKESEQAYFKRYSDKTYVLPASTPPVSLEPQQGTEPYFLFHGNLSVPENDEGARWLIEEIFAPLQFGSKLKIAGKNPSGELFELCDTHNVELIPNPSMEHMDELVKTARVHVFYSDQATGVKLKLVQALSTSGHVIVNHKMIEGTNLVDVVNLALIKEDFQYLVQQKIMVELTHQEYHERQVFLESNFDTISNCQLILELI